MSRHDFLPHRPTVTHDGSEGDNGRRPPSTPPPAPNTDMPW
jgi:hypothetical protein